VQPEGLGELKNSLHWVTIIIIPLKLKLLLRVKKNKVGIYDLQWLHRYAGKEIYIHTFYFIYIYIYMCVCVCVCVQVCN
jgi:hypothetical protein